MLPPTASQYQQQQLSSSKLPLADASQAQRSNFQNTHAAVDEWANRKRRDERAKFEADTAAAAATTTSTARQHPASLGPSRPSRVHFNEQVDGSPPLHADSLVEAEDQEHQEHVDSKTPSELETDRELEQIQREEALEAAHTQSVAGASGPAPIELSHATTTSHSGDGVSASMDGMQRSPFTGAKAKVQSMQIRASIHRLQAAIEQHMEAEDRMMRSIAQLVEQVDWWTMVCEGAEVEDGEEMPEHVQEVLGNTVGGFNFASRWKGKRRAK